MEPKTSKKVNAKKQKILFITHASSNLNYGAARSLGLLLRNISYPFDIMFPIIPISRNIISRSYLKEYCGSSVQNIFFNILLPFNYNAIFGEKYHRTSNDSILKEYIKKYAYTLSKFFLRNIIRIGKYKYIHLNSLGFSDLIDKNQNYIIHVREVFSGSNIEFENVSRHLSLAKLVIFIDHSTYLPFREINMNYVILENPFDMRYVQEIKTEDLISKYNIDTNKVIVSILGVIDPIKGVDFVIDAYNHAKNENLILLVVGRYENKNYYENCINIANNNPNIIFTGDLKNPGEIFKISDYILRGDDIFCIGRTVNEGLYSGCNAIIPYSPDSEVNLSIFDEKYHEKIKLYIARDLNSLADVLNKCTKVNQESREYVSNLEEYVTKFKAVTGLCK